MLTLTLVTRVAFLGLSVAFVMHIQSFGNPMCTACLTHMLNERAGGPTGFN